MYKDAVFVSPHVHRWSGSCGVLIYEKLFSNPVPFRPGGGTVFRDFERSSISLQSYRERGGRYGHSRFDRAGLAFHIRSEVSSEALHSLEGNVKILKRFDTMRNVVVVARQVQPRLPVFLPCTFDVRVRFFIHFSRRHNSKINARTLIFEHQQVRHGEKYLHPKLVSAVLNDVRYSKSLGLSLRWTVRHERSRNTW